MVIQCKYDSCHNETTFEKCPFEWMWKWSIFTKLHYLTFFQVLQSTFCQSQLPLSFHCQSTFSATTQAVLNQSPSSTSEKSQPGSNSDLALMLSFLQPSIQMKKENFFSESFQKNLLLLIGSREQRCNLICTFQS